jgi:hypothetical protein
MRSDIWSSLVYGVKRDEEAEEWEIILTEQIYNLHSTNYWMR